MNFLFSFSGSRIRILSAGSFSWNIASSLDPDSKNLFLGPFFLFLAPGLAYFSVVFLRPWTSGTGLYFISIANFLVDCCCCTFFFLSNYWRSQGHF